MSLSNSSFTKVINYNLNVSKLFLQIPFSYNEKIEKLEEVLKKVLDEIKKDKDVKGVEMLGVDGFEDSYINYALAVDCNPNTHIRVKRILLRNIKMAFDENGISIPYNQLDIHIEK